MKGSVGVVALRQCTNRQTGFEVLQSTRGLHLLRIAPAHGLVNTARWNNAALKKMALQVPSRELRPIRILHFHSRIVFGMSIWVPGVELAPFVFHRLILTPVDVSCCLGTLSADEKSRSLEAARWGAASKWRPIHPPARCAWITPALPLTCRLVIL